MKSAITIFFEEMAHHIGDGPMRFAPDYDNLRSINAQIEALSDEELECFNALKHKWEARYPTEKFADEMILRFARCSPGNRFDKKAAWKTMKSYEKSYVALSIVQMEAQLRTKVSTPLLLLLLQAA
jgi:hypothetical protein